MAALGSRNERRSIAAVRPGCFEQLPEKGEPVQALACAAGGRHERTLCAMHLEQKGGHAIRAWKNAIPPPSADAQAAKAFTASDF